MARLLQCLHRAYVWEVVGDSRKGFSVGASYSLFWIKQEISKISKRVNYTSNYEFILL